MGENGRGTLPYALFQVSCAIQLQSPESSNGDPQCDAGPPARIFEEVERDLQHFGVECEGQTGFDVRPLYEQPSPDPETPEHSLLRSRHRVLDIGECFRSKDHCGFPSALAWDGRNPEDATWDLNLRVQIARDNKERTDINDWLIMRGGGARRYGSPLQPPGGPRDDLDSLRNFFAYLFAQRRQAVFASSVTDRSYNVWLPPALLMPTGSCNNEPCQPESRALVMLPFLTLLRTPHESSWRPIVTVTALFVPVTAGQEHSKWKLIPRTLANDKEARQITSSLKGSISQAIVEAQGHYKCCGQLSDYLRKVTHGKCPQRRAHRDREKQCNCLPPLIPFGVQGASTACDARDHDSSAAGGTSPKWTIRQYLEAILLTTVARAPQAKPGTQGRAKPAEHDRQRVAAASSVACSIQLTSVWSVQLLSREEIAWGEKDLRYIPAYAPEQSRSHAMDARMLDRDSSQVAGLPQGVRRVIKELAGIGHLPTWADRVDDVSTVDKRSGSMTWSMPRFRCILAVQSVRDDHFPGTSPLNSFARVGVMVMAAASIRETTQALLADTVRTQRPAYSAHVDRNLLLELEEVYGSDIVEPSFARFYRSLRKHLDLDEEHQRVQERVKSLSAAINQETAAKANKGTVAVAIAAAAFGAALLLMGFYKYPNTRHITGLYDWAAYAIPAIALLSAVIAVIVVNGRPSKTRWRVVGAVACILVIFFFVVGISRLDFLPPRNWYAHGHSRSRFEPAHSSAANRNI